tara:strand:- start:18 stop:287 length:270 start_codon:yes stop_codon:yes gene_type:complete
MTSSLYAGRKFLGPLDIAQINAVKSKENLIRTAVLQEIVKELQDIESQLENEKLSKTDQIMLKLLKTQINTQLCDFLGLPNDEGTPENS